MNTSELKKMPIERLKYLVKENTNEEKAAQSIRFAQLKERALRNDEICVGSIKCFQAKKHKDCVIQHGFMYVDFYP